LGNEAIALSDIFDSMGERTKSSHTWWRCCSSHGTGATGVAARAAAAIALACMCRGAAGAVARLGCAVLLEPPLVLDAPCCRSHSCLPCRQSTKLSSTRTLTTLACGAVVVCHVLQAAATLLLRCSQLTRRAGGESRRVEMWMDGWMDGQGRTHLCGR